MLCMVFLTYISLLSMLAIYNFGKPDCQTVIGTKDAAILVDRESYRFMSFCFCVRSLECPQAPSSSI